MVDPWTATMDRDILVIADRLRCIFKTRQWHTSGMTAVPILYNQHDRVYRGLSVI